MKKKFIFYFLRPKDTQVLRPLQNSCILISVCGNLANFKPFVEAAWGADKKNYISLPPIDIHVKKQVSFQIPASTRKYVHFVDPFPEIDETY